MRLPVLLAPVLLAVAVLVGGARRTPQAAPAAHESVVRLAADAEMRWVSFALTPGNQIRFAMTLDGRAVSAILDTGVSVSVLARGSAAVDPARVRRGGEAAAIGGVVPIRWMATRSVVLGGLSRTGGRVVVADLPAAATGSAASVDLLVGRDLIGGQALEIDYAARRFRLLRSGRLPFAGTSAPLSISRERRVYETRAVLGDHALAPMIVDTGDGSAVTVTAAGWRAAALPVPTTSAIGYGLAGAIVTGLAIAPQVTVGATVARDVEVRIEPADGFSQSIGVAGRIGSGFLQRYHVLLDPGAGRMVLAPRPDATGAARSTSGLLLGVLPGRLRVVHVMRGGPAAAAGWRVDDEICAIDGTRVPADYPTSPLADWSAGEPGRVVRLDLCDGRRRALTLARFY